MVDVSGIPNMGFGGGGYFGGIPNQQPAMSAAQINAGMWGNYSPQQAQATQAGIYGPGGFGAQPAYYAGLGAAYGRATGGFGMQPAAPAPAADPWAGTGFDPIQYLHNNPDVAAATGGDPMKAYEHARSYGVNEGRGGTDMFDPGESWSPPQERINQGFDAYPNWSPQSQAPNFNDLWSGRGAQSLARDNLFNDYSGMMNPQPQQPGGLEWLYQQMGLPQPWTSPMSPNAGAGYGGFDTGMTQKGNPYRDLIMNYAPEPISQTDTGQLFDSIKYLQQNPDVARAGQPGWEHYNKFGRGEGREATWGNAFDPNTYLRMNQDVQQAGMDPRTHWLKYGQGEGRQGGGVLNNTRDEIATLLTGSPTGPAAQATAAGLGGRPYDTWNPMTGGNASVQQLVNQGAGLNMPSGFGGATYANSKMFGAPSSGYLGAQGANVQDPFGGYVNPQDLDAGGSFPGNYQPRFNAYGNAFGQ